MVNLLKYAYFFIGCIRYIDKATMPQKDYLREWRKLNKNALTG